MNITDIKKIRDIDEYEAALVDLVNNYHDRVGTTDEERPDFKAELQKAAGTFHADSATLQPPGKSGVA
jgi:hypothetical protein